MAVRNHAAPLAWRRGVRPHSSRLGELPAVDGEGDTITDKSYTAPAMSQYVARETRTVSGRAAALEFLCCETLQGREKPGGDDREMGCYCTKTALHFDEAA